MNAIEALQKYLSKDKPLSLKKYEKLWKGLFYAMWFSDKPRPQQRLADTLGSLFSDTIPPQSFLLFVEAHWVVIIHEWPQIDHHRIDKFYLMLRRVIGGCFAKLAQEEWKTEFVEEYLNTLEKNVLSGEVKIPLSLPSHVIDVYLDELEKIIFKDIHEGELGKEDLDEKQQKELLENIQRQKVEIVKNLPIKQLFSVFERLLERTLIKVLKEKIQDELFGDERLKEWGVSLNDDEEEALENEEKDADDLYFQ